ncbi:MAG: biotin--[acetyl-CoA-carboxylase] ligase [Sphaerochaetaceae bacterium]|nr:biotin--[acetyl-CoA-carboxylase] ligase [Sphaerochaetaceae bacterium]
MSEEFNVNLNYFDSVDSTNRVLKDMCDKGAPNGTVAVAWSQSGGRGRLGRSFASPRGGIYLSILLPMDESLSITAKAAVAVRRAISYCTDRECDIKWVNDLYYRGKKVCGILAEAYKGHVVLGIGINFCTPQKAFPPELQDVAISLYPGPDKTDSDPMDVVNEVVKNLISLSLGEDDSWLIEYQNHSMLTGKTVDVIQAGKVTSRGVVSKIDNNCALHIIEKDGQELILSTGEVSIRI